MTPRCIIKRYGSNFGKDRFCAAAGNTPDVRTVSKMKKQYLFILVISLSLCNILMAQLPFGIYRLSAPADTTFVHTLVSPNVPLHPPQSGPVSYRYSYQSLVDYADYAVILPLENFGYTDKNGARIIVLNKSSSKNRSMIYSDGLPRRYFAFDIQFAGGNENSRRFWTSRCYSEGFACYADFNNESSSGNFFFAKEYAGADYSLRGDTLLLMGTYYNLVKDSSQSITDAGKFIQERDLALFALHTKRSYTTAISLPFNTRFYFNDPVQKADTVLSGGDFIAVTSETDEWLYGDHISVDGNFVPGKIFIDDLTPGDSATLVVNGVTLSIRYLPGDTLAGYSSYGSVIRIKTRYQGKLLQVLKEGGVFYDTAQLVQLEDVNFDDYPDLVVQGDNIGVVNNSNNYYVFDPRTKKFVFNETLSGLTQPEIDPKEKRIYSYARGGAGAYSSEKYKWEKGVLQLQEQHLIQYTDGENVEVSIRLYKKGKLVKEDNEVLTQDAYWDNKSLKKQIK